jgi:tRNA G18 (ribose-2'-O)-methylase SpoU
MPLIPIADVDDPRLEAYRNLKATNATRYSCRLIAEGDKLVHRLIASGLAVDSLLLAEPYVAEFAPLVSPQTPLYVVAKPHIDQIVGFNFHRGVLASAARPRNVGLDELCGRAARLTLVVLPEVHDPVNLGAILRISAAFGVDGVAIGRDCCDPFARRVLRVSMGAAFRLPIAQVDDLAGELANLQQEQEVEAWATVTDRDAEPFDRVVRPYRLALVLGSEGHGLTSRWCRLCQRQITIPMRTDFDSLNVAVAAGLLLYQLAN